MYKIHCKDKLWFVTLNNKVIASYATCSEAVALVLSHNSITSKYQTI